MKGPLEGYRVLDITGSEGYFCGAILAQLGADVIKIEEPGGDPGRKTGPFAGNVPDPECSLFWLALNVGKRGITLDLKLENGRQLFKKLVAKADFLLESFPVGYLENLKLGYNVLRKDNPGLVFVSITGFGQTGPYKSFKCNDFVSLAMAGYTYVTGDADRPPAGIQVPLASYLACAEAAVGALIAHYHRWKIGEGQCVDTSIQHSASWLAGRARLWYEVRGKIIHRSGPMYQYTPGKARRFVWECKDGAVVYTVQGGPTGESQNRLLARWMREEGIPSEALDGATWEKADIPDVAAEIEASIQKLFKRYTKAELFKESIKRGIILGPVNNIKEAMEDSQLRYRGFWEQIEHPQLGRSLSYPGAFFKSSLTGCVPRKRAPAVGQDDEEIYKEIGVTAEELIAFRRAGVI